jgi:Cys-rich repeat protein
LDNECALNEICTPGAQRCKLRNCFGTDCKLNSDCSLGNFCVQGLCLDPRNQQTGPDACTVTNCTVNADCLSTQICDITNKVCVLNLGCAEDNQCPSGESCNVAASTCEPSCTADTAYQICGLKQQCYMGICVDCVSDSDCGTGLSCNLNTHQCVGFEGCTKNADCPPPLVCNNLTQQCTAPPGPCSGNESCPPGYSCQIQSGTCVPTTCMMDRFAPNQTLDTAKPIPTGNTSGLTLCQNEVSYFSQILQNGDVLTVVVTPQYALVPFDVAILDVAGNVLAESNDYSVAVTAPSDGTFYIRTETSDSYVNYGLQVSVTQGTPCTPFPASNSWATALPETPGNLEQICDSDAGPCGPPTVCPGGHGWYVLAVAPGQTLSVTLQTTALNGPLDLYLYDSNGTTLLGSSPVSMDTMNTQTASATGFSGHSGYVEVVPDQPGTGNTYSLQLLVTGP